MDIVNLLCACPSLQQTAKTSERQATNNKFTQLNQIFVRSRVLNLSLFFCFWSIEFILLLFIRTLCMCVCVCVWDRAFGNVYYYSRAAGICAMLM